MFIGFPSADTSGRARAPPGRAVRWPNCACDRVGGGQDKCRPSVFASGNAGARAHYPRSRANSLNGARVMIQLLSLERGRSVARPASPRLYRFPVQLSRPTIENYHIFKLARLASDRLAEAAASRYCSTAPVRRLPGGGGGGAQITGRGIVYCAPIQAVISCLRRARLRFELAHRISVIVRVGGGALLSHYVYL